MVIVKLLIWSSECQIGFTKKFHNIKSATIVNKIFLICFLSFLILWWNSLSIVSFLMSLTLSSFQEFMLVIFPRLASCSLSLSLICIQSIKSWYNELLHFYELKSLQQKQNTVSTCLEWTSHFLSRISPLFIFLE